MSFYVKKSAGVVPVSDSEYPKHHVTGNKFHNGCTDHTGKIHCDRMGHQSSTDSHHQNAFASVDRNERASHKSSVCKFLSSDTYKRTLPYPSKETVYEKEKHPLISCVNHSHALKSITGFSGSFVTATSVA